VVKPPAGWIEDKEVSEQNHVTLLTPDKPDLGAEDALIYVQTSVENGDETLDQIIKVNLDQWRRNDPRSKATPEGAFAPPFGGEGFKLYLFENPDRPKQAFERIAYGFFKGADNKRYFLTVVDTGATKKVIDGADAAFRSVLAQF